MRYYDKIHSKLPIFRVKSVKIYTGQKKFTWEFSWLSWQIWGKSMWEKNSFDIVSNFFLLVCEAVTRRYVSCGNWWRLIRLSVPSDYIRRQLVFIFHFSFSSINDDHVSLLLWSKKKILKHKRRPWFFSAFFSSLTTKYDW